jgi:amino acid transporter
LSTVPPTEHKGLKEGALGFVSSTAVGVASTAPAYSLAGTLGFVVVAIGLQTPLIVVLAFIPMFLSAWANKEMNAIDPDCGTSFTWAARALGPYTGWFAGGWGTIAADLLAMASQSQIAGQYFFLLIGAKSVGNNASSGWVLLVGVAWIVVLTWICYRGIELSARLQVSLLAIEIVMLLALAVVALIRVLDGSAPVGHIDPSWSWFDPGKLASFKTFMDGMLLMVFIYWGWDTTTSINEETEDPADIPGRAGVLSTFLLLGTYLLVTIGVQSFAGIGTKGIGLGNPNHVNDVFSVMGSAVFGTGGVGTVLSKLLLFMVLTSAAATTQTTILPNARTTLSMAFHKAMPEQFGRVHPRYKTPTVSTVVFSIAATIFYVVFNFLSHGNVISDSITACCFFICLYLGITGIACAWHFRGTIGGRFRPLLSKFLIPGLSGLMLFFLLVYSVYFYGDPTQSYTVLKLPFVGDTGGVLLIGVVTAVVGLLLMFWCRWRLPAFFRDHTIRYDSVLTEEGDVKTVLVEDPAAGRSPD